MQTGTKLQPEAVPPPPVEVAEESEFDLARAREHAIARLRLLWSERRWIGRAVLASIAAGLLLAFLLPKQYQASTQLMPPDSQSGSGMAMLAALSAKTGNGLGAFAGDLLGVKSSGALFIGILRSRTVEDRLIERFNLKKVYSDRLEEDARKKLAENTSIAEDRKSGIITLTVTDRDARRSAAIAQAYIEELDRLVAELSTSAARRERVFLEERLKAVKLDLDQAAQEFSQFASRSGAIDIKEQGRAMVEAAATLQGQMIAAQSELSGLEQIYTGNNVRVRALRARIGELQQQLAKIGGSEGDSAAGTAAGAGEKSMYPSIRKLPILGVTYANLFRRTKIQEVVFETLTQQYELAKVQEAKETPSVKILDAATVPERKSFPPRLLIVFLFAFFGLAGAMAWVLARTRWQEVAANDPGKVFATEVFQTMNAQMPWAPPNGSRVQAMTHRVWLRVTKRNDSAKSAEETSNRP
ncbi:MAG: lipopolysaccharide biosynthesis protein [Acidobacteriia bacterium]|nr:lipopolysaccharide biosynthesis protein [Terriglobia bacterium]